MKNMFIKIFISFFIYKKNLKIHVEMGPFETTLFAATALGFKHISKMNEKDKYILILTIKNT